MAGVAFAAPAFLSADVGETAGGSGVGRLVGAGVGVPG